MNKPPHSHISYLHLIFTLILILSEGISHAAAIKHGMRFSSYGVKVDKRSSLSLGKKPFRFSDELTLEFDLNFYSPELYGSIFTLTTDSDTKINLLSSATETRFVPALVINDQIFPIDLTLARQSRPYQIALRLDNAAKKATLTIDRNSYSFPYDPAQARSATITFGTYPQSFNSAPPIDLSNVKVYADKRQIANWPLREHSADTCVDIISHIPAIASNPHWLIDDHTIWRSIFSISTDEEIQSAFNPATSSFYIVGNDRLITLNPISGDTTLTAIAADGRTMKFSNHIFFDPAANTLISYNPHLLRSSFLNPSTGRWSSDLSVTAEATYGNHAIAPADSLLYVFGGYGFHRFNNSLFSINLLSGAITPLELNPRPTPRSGAAACVYGGKLYIFGGIGNESGRQELPLSHLYDLWEYDLATLQGKQILSLPKPYKNDFLCSSQMYFEPADSAFYFASTLTGGMLMRLTLDPPAIECMSHPIHSDMYYRDCVLELFRSADANTYYLLLDRRHDDLTHSLNIYQISAPFTPVPPGSGNASSASSSGSPTLLTLILAICAIVLLAATVIFFIRRRAESRLRTIPSTATVAPAASSPTPSVQSKDDDDEARQPYRVRLLGTFSVTDNAGNDISGLFTNRLRELLAILILYSMHDNKGISQQQLDEDIWSDKGEKAAKSNRNVYIHKLRSLLDRMGDTSIIYEKGYYRIDIPHEHVDYMHVMDRYAASPDDAGLDYIQPILPAVQSPWLDSFKARFSSMVLNAITPRLQSPAWIAATDPHMVLRIAETVAMHDPLNEEALKIRCRILYMHKMHGMARTIYDTFIREYAKCMGEPYPLAISQIINQPDIHPQERI